MQEHFQNKIKYINSLINVGFDIIDFGSFVSHKHVPQMRDTEEVLIDCGLLETEEEEEEVTTEAVNTSP